VHHVLVPTVTSSMGSLSPLLLGSPGLQREGLAPLTPATKLQACLFEHHVQYVARSALAWQACLSVEELYRQCVWAQAGRCMDHRRHRLEDQSASARPAALPAVTALRCTCRVPCRAVAPRDAALFQQHEQPPWRCQAVCRPGFCKHPSVLSALICYVPGNRPPSPCPRLSFMGGAFASCPL
jgi:hypothetical protein